MSDNFVFLIRFCQKVKLLELVKPFLFHNKLVLEQLPSWAIAPRITAPGTIAQRKIGPGAIGGSIIVQQIITPHQ